MTAIEIHKYMRQIGGEEDFVNFIEDSIPENNTLQNFICDWYSSLDIPDESKRFDCTETRIEKSIVEKGK